MRQPKPLPKLSKAEMSMWAGYLEDQLDESRRMREIEAELARETIRVEEVKRVSAQRGLVPYVRALEQFDKWLIRNPALRKKLEPILRELGIWEIKLGYDPLQDLELSAISPRRK